MIAPEFIRQLVIGRLVVLQNKRLLLAINERHLNQPRGEHLRERVERLREETKTAQHRYRETLLRWGTPAIDGYLPTVYSRLVEMADVLGHQLEAAIDDLPVSERYEVAADIEMLDHMARRWSEAKRVAMAESVA